MISFEGILGETETNTIGKISKNTINFTHSFTLIQYECMGEKKLVSTCESSESIFYTDIWVTHAWDLHIN